MNWDDIGQALFGGSSRYGEILQLVQNSVWAGAVLGIVGALLLRASVLFAGYYEPILL